MRVRYESVGRCRYEDVGVEMRMWAWDLDMM